MKTAIIGAKRRTHVLLILLIGIIGINAFTSCSGDDGDDGAAGPPGPKGDNGATPSCTDGTWHIGTTNTAVSCVGQNAAVPACTDGTWHVGATDTEISCAGADGSNGEPCSVEDDGAYFVMNCPDETSVRWAKAMCGATAYDPAALTGGIVCGGTEFVLYDSRDKKSYKIAEIGTQTWMAENLNYAAAGSKCGDGGTVRDDNTAACDAYGRLYNWETAMDACPAGWHLPDNDEWDALMAAAGGISNAGKRLKAASGWDWNSNDNVSGNGEDTHGFAALPGGNGHSALGSFQHAGEGGFWWSATDDNADDAYLLEIHHDSDEANISSGVNNKILNLLSVRCVKDMGGL